MNFKTPEELLAMGRKFPLSPKKVGAIVIGILAVVALSTMIYQINTEEQGVILRLGKFVRITEPGLHIKLPFGIETVTPVKVTTIFKEEFGFRSARTSQGQSSSREYLEEALMLTGDLNSLVVTWIVQFKVRDPVYLLYRIRDPRDNLRDLSEAVMRTLVADYSVDEVISVKRDEISITAKEKLQEILDTYDSGLQVTQLQLKDVKPPGEVQPAFNEVNQAEQEKERVVNEALQAYNKVIPKAVGQAEKTILEAEGYALQRVNEAMGDASRFSAVLAEYHKAPDVTKRRMYLEAIQKVLSNTKEKYVIDPSQSGVVPLLDFRKRGDS